MQLQPYLFFDGRCEEALEYYKKTVGAKVGMLMRFKDNPDVSQSGGCGGEGHPGMPPGSEEKVMHTSFRIGDTDVMASDGNCGGKPSFQGFSLSLSVKDEAEAERVFSALADGGDKVKYFEGTPIPSSVLIVALLAVAAWQGAIGDAIWFGQWQLGPWQLHPLVLVFALSGSLMISKTIRIPKF